MIARSDTDSPWQRVLTRSLRSTSTPTDPLTPPSFELQLSKLHWLLAVIDKNVLCPKKNNIEELLKIGSRPTSQLVAWIMKHTFLLPGSRKVRLIMAKATDVVTLFRPTRKNILMKPVTELCHFYSGRFDRIPDPVWFLLVRFIDLNEHTTSVGRNICAVAHLFTHWMWAFPHSSERDPN